MQKVNILAVDDHPENLVALEAILGDLDLNLVKANSGREALKCLLGQEVALILLDVAMPGMDGFDTAALIRARERTRHTPIIFLTAINKADPYVFKGYALGAVDYIFKPFASEVLRSKVLVFVDLFSKTEEVKRQAELLRKTNRELDEANKQMTALYKELEAKNAELQRERDFVSTVLHMAGSLVVILDRQGRILRFNRACEQITGYSMDEVKGQFIGDLFWIPEEAEAGRMDFENVLTGAFPIAREAHWRTRDGQRRLIAWSHTALVGADGAVETIIGTGMDITERQEAENARVQFAREQAARAEAEAAQRRSAFLAEASAILASSLHDQSTLTQAARSAVPTLGDWCLICLLKEDGVLHPVEVAHASSPRDELIHQLYPYLSHHVRKDPAINQAVQTGGSVLIPQVSDSFLDSLADQDEHRALLQQIGFRAVLVAPLPGRGRPLGAIEFVLADSNRRFDPADVQLAEDWARRVAMAMENARLYREAQEANRAKDEFLATVSHELRTPLTAVLGWARMLRTGKLDEPTTERAIETIERNARAQAQLIEDILDVSRIVLGKLRLEVRPVELSTILEAVLDTARPMASAKGVEIATMIDPSAGAVLGDPDRLQQVFWNLLSNAIKFTPSGGRVDVRLGRSGAAAQVTIRDTGKGIPPDFLPYVFERFRQADGTITRTHSGLGLGLAIVHHLVELHGGTVTAASPGEGQGATFTVNLPAQAANLKSADAESALPADAEAATGRNVRPLTGLRVLVVDDEADTCDFISTLLRQSGAEVEAARSVHEALAALTRWTPDILLSDISMPGEDGYDLIRKVRALESSRGGKTPAVALTAYTRPEDRLQALGAGYQMHIAKPVEPVELIKVVASLTRRLGSL